MPREKSPEVKPGKFVASPAPMGGRGPRGNWDAAPERLEEIWDEVSPNRSDGVKSTARTLSERLEIGAGSNAYVFASRLNKRLGNKFSFKVSGGKEPDTAIIWFTKKK